MRSGFVSLIGRPNVGKSTLLNTLINQKIAITSNKPQTTRNIIQGIYNEEGYQIVFVDTPGIHKPLNKLGKVLNKEAQSLTKDVDVVLFVYLPPNNPPTSGPTSLVAVALTVPLLIQFNI